MSTPVRPPRSQSITLVSGWFLIVAGVFGLVVGLLVVSSVENSLGDSLDISATAVSGAGETVDLVDRVLKTTDQALEEAATAARSAATTTRVGSQGLAELASFLEYEIPTDLESLSDSLPAAISAADAIDATLRAVALFGPNYSRREPFGVSLRRVHRALVDLPDAVADQGKSLRSMVRPTESLAEDVDGLSAALGDVIETIEGADGLVNGYLSSVQAAEQAVANAESSLATTIALMRLIVVVGSVGAMLTGLSLRAIAGFVRSSLVASPKPTAPSRQPTPAK